MTADLQKAELVRLIDLTLEDNSDQRACTIARELKARLEAEADQTLVALRDKFLGCDNLTYNRYDVDADSITCDLGDKCECVKVPPRDGVVAEPRFPIGAFVQKTGGDYTYQGNVVALVWKRDGKTLRYVVENDGGMLFIFNGKQLERGTAMSSDRATLLNLMGEG